MEWPCGETESCESFASRWKTGEKSGSARVCYVDFLALEIVYLITVYPKGVKENLTNAERNNIKKMIDQLEQNIMTEV